MDLTEPDRPVRLGVVGRGFRARAWLHLARRLPTWFTLVGATGRPGGDPVQPAPGIPVHPDLGALLAAAPEVVVVSLRPEEHPDVVRAVVGAGVPVLVETPPAADVEGLRRLWSDVGAGGTVQVAEQYPLTPASQARLAVVRAGTIGRPTGVQVSSTHLHHAAALVRAALGAGGAPTEVRAVATSAPLLDPVGRAGWAEDPQPRPVTTTVATLDLGDGCTALYDYTANQMRNPLRSRRLLVRGTHGELVDDRVVRYVGPRTVVASALERRQTGLDLDLEPPGLDSYALDGHLLHRNPFPRAGLSDEDLAMATLLARSGAWARGQAPAPYPLAEGCQDARLGLAITEAAATGAPVRTGREVWAEQLDAGRG